MRVVWHPLSTSGDYRIDEYASRFGYEQPDELEAFRTELHRTIRRAIVRAQGDPLRYPQQIVDDLVGLFEWRSCGLPPAPVKRAPREPSAWFVRFLGALWHDCQLPPVTAEDLAGALARAEPRAVAAYYARRQA